MNRIGLALSVVLLAGIFGCGSGGGGGVGVAGPVLAGFEAEAPAKTTDSVSMTEVSQSGNEVTIAININATQSISGAAFDVMFDTTNITYVGHAPGTALEQGGHVPIYTVDSTAGGVVVAATRTGGSTTNVSGTKALILLTFQVQDVGTFGLSIQNQELYGSGAPPVAKVGIEWAAGNLVGN